MDFDVLYMCAESSGNYKKYRSYVKDHCIQPETKFILDVMGDYYTTYSADKVDWEALDSFIFSKHSARIGKTSVTLKSILERAKVYEPSIAYDEVIKSFIEKDYVAQVMQECSEVLKIGRAHV